MISIYAGDYGKKPRREQRLQIIQPRLRHLLFDSDIPWLILLYYIYDLYVYIYVYNCKVEHRGNGISTHL